MYGLAKIDMNLLLNTDRYVIIILTYEVRVLHAFQCLAN